MNIFDLSQPLYDDCPNCPVHPPVQIPRTADHPSDGWRMEMFHMAFHTGTHLDAPLHKLASGRSIDQYPLHSFIGPARCADLTHLSADHPISAVDLKEALGSSGELTGSIVLLNTGWGQKRAKTDEWLYHSPFLAPDGAQWLVEQKVKGVGIDHFSIGGTRDPENTRTHEILLGAEMWVIEELYFREGWRAAAVDAEFQALPLLVPGASGSPCRAILIQNA